MAVKGFIAERIKIVCPCGNSIMVNKSKSKTRKYCSKACCVKFHVPVRKGMVFSNSYTALHLWINKNKVKKDYCEFCGKTNCEIQWANKSHEYKRELSDWLCLCISCHRKHDLDENGMKRTDIEKVYGITTDNDKRRVTKKQILEIYLSGDSQKIISNKYNIPANEVSLIKSGKRYKKITSGIPKVIVSPSYFKLNEKQVIDIFHAKGNYRDISDQYNISMSVISLIKSRQRWKKVTMNL